MLIYFIPPLCIFNYCINFFNTYVRIVIFGFLLYYLCLPLIFRVFVAPKFDASYKPKSKDFKNAELIETLPKQLNTPSLKIHQESGLFEISFGKGRELIEGFIKLRCAQQEYSNQKTLGKSSKRLNVKGVDISKGNDALGGFNQTIISLSLEGKEKNIQAIFNEYPGKNYVIFELKFPDGLENTATGSYGDLITSFPSFINKSPNKKVFTFRHAIFCPPNRKLEPTSAPVVLYDEELNCVVISAFDGFLNNATMEDEDGRINCGIQGEIREIPPGANQKFILLFDKGINGPLNNLGNLLRKYHGVQRKDPYCSIAVSHLSYWTDNGAYYYYQKERGMSYEDTMVAVKNYFESHQIPFQSYNFDSWWYVKYQSAFKKFLATVFKPLFRILGGGLFGNTIRWEADPKHFSTDLATYHKERFKYPIIAHSRRWDARSPYLNDYDFEVDENNAVPLKRDFWNWCMKHAKESGIEVYEQDWMKNQVNSISILREDFTAKERWLNSMATAAKDNGVDVFYCMMTPGMLLYSIKHSNIVMGRCSGDYNHRWPPVYREVFGTQTCMLFNLAGINPFQDVFCSSYELLGEQYPELKCLVQVLTSGVVGPGDKKEKINWPLLRKSCRDDGLLLKPDKPLTANDLMFKKHHKYYICDTITKHAEDLTWHYVLIMNMWPRRVENTSISPLELGFNEKELVCFDYLSNRMTRIDAEESIKVGELKKYHHAYYILCPITDLGMTLIGCPDKFVPASKKQFPSVSIKNDSLEFEVEDLADVSLRVHVYSESTPSSVQVDGVALKKDSSENHWNYNADANRLELFLKFENAGRKQVIINK